MVAGSGVKPKVEDVDVYVDENSYLGGGQAQGVRGQMQMGADDLDDDDG